jgi:hypothetical protein
VCPCGGRGTQRHQRGHTSNGRGPPVQALRVNPAGFAVCRPRDALIGLGEVPEPVPVVCRALGRATQVDVVGAPGDVGVVARCLGRAEGPLGEAPERAVSLRVGPEVTQVRPVLAIERMANDGEGG